MITFTIPLAPVTKKNHQQIYVNKKTGKPFVTQSQKYKDYEEAAALLIPKAAKLAINQPVNVKAIFYVKRNARVDISNLHSALHDVLVYAGVLADDSSINPEIIVSTDGSRVYVDRQNPRTEVTITPAK